jgi:Ca2+-binding EF-hand superfamily protein
MVALAGGTWLLAVGSAMGQDANTIPQERQKQMLEKHPDADANNDGTLTRQELREYWQAHRGQRQGRREGEPGMGGPPRPGRKGFGGPGKGGHPQRGGPVFAGPGMGPGFGSPPEGPRLDKLLQRHPELDADKDGKLSPQEWQAAREKLGPPPGGPHMAGPGMVFALDMLLQRFDTADKDGNGQLSREEIAQLKEKLAAERPGPFGPGAGPGTCGKIPPDCFADADTDKDGKLSPDEFKALCAKRPPMPRHGILDKVPEADTDKDGTLSKEELKALKDKQPRPPRHERRGRGAPGQPDEQP